MPRSTRTFLHHYTHQTSKEEAATFCGGVGVIRRDAFFSVGGFDPKHRFMEDVELGIRLHRAGHRIRLHKELQVTHLKHYTFAGLIRSDVIGRAIPWTRIMLDSRVIRNDLFGTPGLAQRRQRAGFVSAARGSRDSEPMAAAGLAGGRGFPRSEPRIPRYSPGGSAASFSLGAQF